MEKASFTVKFWGVRGSHPVPGESTIRFGGNTPCVEIHANGQTIILDAGTGLIGLGRSLMARPRQKDDPLEATILLSHVHHDHIQGLPFFLPAYHPKARLHFFGPGSLEQDLEAVLVRNQMPPLFPVALREMAAAKDIHSIRHGDVIWVGANMEGATLTSGSKPTPEGAVGIRVCRSYAHPGGVMIYRIEWRGRSVVYATDTEGYVGADQKLVALARDTDLLIHDAQYAEDHYRGQKAGFPATQGYGHSTATMACEVAAAAGAKRLILFHHDPNYDDATIRQLELQAQVLYPNTLAAYEGLEITLDESPQPFLCPQVVQRSVTSGLRPIPLNP